MTNAPGHGGRSRILVFLVAAAGLALLAFAGGARPGAAATGMLPDAAVNAPLAKAKGEQSAVFAGGCFWGVQAVFQHVGGVISATSGYSGGAAASANYEAVSGGDTGHAEAVKVVYDPAKISYGQLLKVFFAVAHDPTQLDRQGPDTGSQYRSAIFYANPEQRRIAEAYVDQLQRARLFAKPVVTQIAALTAFYPAESYHQNYAALHPTSMYIVINDLPKLAQLKADFPALYRAAPPY